MQVKISLILNIMYELTFFAFVAATSCAFAELPAKVGSAGTLSAVAGFLPGCQCKPRPTAVVTPRSSSALTTAWNCRRISRRDCLISSAGVGLSLTSWTWRTGLPAVALTVLFSVGVSASGPGVTSVDSVERCYARLSVLAFSDAVDEVR